MSVREMDAGESESIMSNQLVALACRFGVSLLLRPGALVSSEIIAHCLLTVHTHYTNCAHVRESAVYGGAYRVLIMKPYIYEDKHSLNVVGILLFENKLSFIPVAVCNFCTISSTKCNTLIIILSSQQTETKESNLLYFTNEPCLQTNEFR